MVLRPGRWGEAREVLGNTLTAGLEGADDELEVEEAGPICTAGVLSLVLIACRF